MKFKRPAVLLCAILRLYSWLVVSSKRADVVITLFSFLLYQSAHKYKFLSQSKIRIMSSTERIAMVSNIYISFIQFIHCLFWNKRGSAPRWSIISFKTIIFTREFLLLEKVFCFDSCIFVKISVRIEIKKKKGK